MVEVRQGDIKGKVPKTPNNGTTNIPILSLEVWEWYGLTIGDTWKNPVMILLKKLKKKHVNLGVGNVKKIEY